MINLEKLRNCDIGQHNVHILFENIPKKKQLNGKNYFAVENIHVIAEGELVTRFYNCSNMCFVRLLLTFAT